MDKRMVKWILFLSLLTFLSCNPHNADDFRFSIRNTSQGDIWFRSFTSGIGDGTNTDIGVNEIYVTGGGGIIDVDSVIFICQYDNDSLIYRNERHGGDLSESNHFFNLVNWIEENTNKYYYNISDGDFDR